MITARMRRRRRLLDTYVRVERDEREQPHAGRALSTDGIRPSPPPTTLPAGCPSTTAETSRTAQAC